jgi:predicted metal-binding membrane protein
MAMMTRVKLLVMALAWGLLMGGCMMPHSSPLIGSAVRAATARQIADPAASDRVDSSTGLDGRAGANLIDRYENSFGETGGSSATMATGKNQ